MSCRLTANCCAQKNNAAPEPQEGAALTDRRATG
jgi:hypothetical protein